MFFYAIKIYHYLNAINTAHHCNAFVNLFRKAKRVNFIVLLSSIFQSFYLIRNRNTAILSQNRFIWLLTLFHVAENPTKYDLSQYLPLYVSIVFMFLILLILIFQFKDFLITLRYKIFLKALAYPLFQYFICFYCHNVLCIKSMFEKDLPILGVPLFLPAVFFTVSSALQEENLGNPFLWMAFWFSLGITLLIFDEQAALINYSLKNDPDHPFSRIFSEYLRKLPKNPNYLEAGFGFLTGKLSAAGQAALYAGIATCTTGIFIAGLNVTYNIYKDRQHLAFAAKEAQDQRDYAAKEAQDQRDYAAKEAQNQRDQAAKEAQNQRDQAAKEAQKQREFSDKKAQKKREFSAQEAQKQRDWQDRKDRQKAYDSSWNPLKKPPK